jgi:hypothetical protein
MADIFQQNVLTAVDDEAMFKDLEDHVSQHPSTPVTNDGAPVYKSRVTGLYVSCIEVLTDLGQMRLAEPMNPRLVDARSLPSSEGAFEASLELSR